MSARTSTPVVVGSTEVVDLPAHSLKDVPAKVDTGADSSAIWASNIEVSEDGVLSYMLFDTPSPFYTGKRITTKSYTISSIKNSFGQSEFRYKVKLKLVLAGRTIQARFTLANRSNNRYPILIGRRTLKGKFVVDVAKVEADKPTRVLVLARKRYAETRRFLDGVAKIAPDLVLTNLTYKDLVFTANNTGCKIAIADTGEDVARFDFVYFKSMVESGDRAAATARYVEKRSVPFMDRATQHYAGSSKLFQYMVLADNGIAVPHTIFYARTRLPGAYDSLKAALGLPFVLKDVHGRKGYNNFLIRDKATFKAACDAAAKDELELVAQEFIPNDGDYRVIVLGSTAALAILRQRHSDETHLNNVSQGASAKLVPLQTLANGVLQDSITAARLLERDIAGVDMIQDKTTGTWYCLEVNDSPQLATGVFLTEKQAAVAQYLASITKRG